MIIFRFARKICERKMDEKASCAHDDKKDASLSLLDLPVEIFLHICSFLEASTLVHSLSLVCKQFNLILKDDSLWRARINHIWPDTSYPFLSPARSDELFWKLSCVAIEKQTALWKRRDSMKKLVIGYSLYTTMDALLLMHGGKTCIAGGRNRTLLQWRLLQKVYPPSQELENPACVDNAHGGWIWDLTAMHNKIYSCSWDQTVRSWLFVNCGLVKQRTYELDGQGALLCVSSCPELSIFAVGSYGKTVFVFDPRTAKKICQYQSHTGAVIKLAMNSEYILSASEDKTVSVWDQRAGRTMKSIAISGEAFPRCINMQRDWVCIGDNTAKLHVLDPKNNFELVKSYSTEHTKGITGVHLAEGCLITSSTDGTVRISSPTDPPRPIATFNSGFGEIARMDYLNGTLAISGIDIAVWRPKMTRSTKY